MKPGGLVGPPRLELPKTDNDSPRHEVDSLESDASETCDVENLFYRCIAFQLNACSA